MKTLDIEIQRRQDERLQWLFHLDKKEVADLIFRDKDSNPIWDKIFNIENLK